MFRSALRAVGGIGVVALVAGLLAAGSSIAPSGAAIRTGAVPGVTDDEIQIVAIVPDLDGLRSRGFDFSQKLTTGNFLKRYQGYADAYGPVHGRKVVFKAAGWDPTDPTSQSSACTKATQDNKPFLVINASGYRQAYVPCVTVDNDTPMISGDPGTGAVQDASGKNLVTLGVPSEVAGKTTARVVAEARLIRKSARIGILSNNDTQIKAGADALQTELEKRGYDVVTKIELNGLAADATLVNREGAAAVGTLQTAEVDTVFLPQSFTSLGGFFDEVRRTGVQFQKWAFDGQASTCTNDAAPRTPPEAAGTQCVTIWATKGLPDKGGIAPDTEFDAQCRQEFDAFMDETSQPGAPNGDTTVNGVVYVEDFAPAECTILSFLMPALEKAGRNPTWDKVHRNIMKTATAPMAYMSNGQGGFAKGKPYMANQVHLVELTAANASTPKDANGVTFNGCPIPQNCFVAKALQGKDWFPVSG